MLFALFLTALTGYFVVLGLAIKSKMLEYPTLAALMYAAFVLPQVFYLERSGLSATFNGWFAWLYMTLCLIMITFGFQRGKALAIRRARSFGATYDQIDERRLVWGAIILCFVGFLSTIQLSQVVRTTQLGSQWTGVATLWYLLLQTTFLAFAISVIRLLSKPNWIYLLIALFTLLSTLSLFAGSAKRHMIFEILVIVGGAFFFVKGFRPPRWLYIIGAIVGIALLNQIGEVRQYIKSGQGNAVQAVIDGVIFEDFDFLQVNVAREVTKAVVDIYAFNQGGWPEGPAELWNELVQQYVPAFIVGRSFKDGLKIETNREGINLSRANGFETLGATRTGFSDTYRGYWIFGCFVFAIIGFFMGTLFGFAVSGHFWAQFYYVVLLNDSLVAITQSTTRFVATLPFIFLFSWLIVRPKTPVLLFKARRNRYCYNPKSSSHQT